MSRAWTSSERRVPFGLHEATGELVDVADVPRGAVCACICPSCRVPLVAHQGTEIAWHFKHETRGTFAQVSGDCDFSLWTALMLMARQELGTAKVLQTPAYEVLSWGETDRLGRLRDVVTEARSLDVASIAIEASVLDVKFDAVIQFEGAALGLLLIHRQKPLPALPTPEVLGTARIGILAIDLEELWGHLPARGGAATTQRGRLREALLNGVMAKRWIFHPSEGRIRSRLEERVREENARAERTSPRRQIRQFPPIIETQGHRPRLYRRFMCVFCNVSWEAFEIGLITCPKCGDHISVSPREALSPPDNYPTTK